jgi:hypothetical protein
MIIIKIIQNFNEQNVNYAAGIYGLPNDFADAIARWKTEGKAVDASDEEKTAYLNENAPASAALYDV